MECSVNLLLPPYAHLRSFKFIDIVMFSDIKMNSDPVFVGILQRRLKDFSIEREQYIWGYIEEHGYSELLNELRTMGYSYSIRQSTINSKYTVVKSFCF